ncbi:MAG: formylglycine-generating enzyme family protein [Planctomycetota bacterium]
MRVSSFLASALLIFLGSGCGSEADGRPPTRAQALGMSFVQVQSGTFERGAPPNEPGRTGREGPVHSVKITRDYWIGQHEVTVGQFAAFVEATGYVTEAERDPKGGWRFVRRNGTTEQSREVNWRSPGYPQAPDHPVVQVSWVDAEAFCAWLSAEDGRKYRLPTEAEWEFACRGETSSPYSFGADPSDLPLYANTADATLRPVFPAVNWNTDDSDGHAFTAPVGQFRENPRGLFDMHGNVWEWCADWHQDGYESADPRVDPTGPEEGRIRAIRGGGWYDPPERCRSATRAWFEPVFRYCQLSGFRVVHEGDEDPSSTTD